MEQSTGFKNLNSLSNYWGRQWSKSQGVWLPQQRSWVWILPRALQVFLWVKKFKPPTSQDGVLNCGWHMMAAVINIKKNQMTDWGLRSHLKSYIFFNMKQMERKITHRLRWGSKGCDYLQHDRVFLEIFTHVGLLGTNDTNGQARTWMTLDTHMRAHNKTKSISDTYEWKANISP